ncbi:HAD-IC family P-type ATPase [Thermoleophilum album]|uniref:HAD-IC family P-type ATPase n=1 Tax=Thermoleophilum album TaxID=29539 RepID=UPI000AF32A70|nr:HAD-IC family P-type ATPase [Thermoleophilum album]
MPGTGVVAHAADGSELRLGRNTHPHLESARARGASLVALERDGRPLALFVLRDGARADARQAVASLHALGIATFLASGDSPQAVRTVADEVGLQNVYARLRPEQKLRLIEELRARFGPVAMVGDGINDTPALAGADVGIALAALAGDAAVAVADCAILADRLDRLPQLVAHARRTRRIVLQNLLAATAIVVTLTPLAALGAIGIAATVTIHELAEVLVVLNGLRAARW